MARNMFAVFRVYFPLLFTICLAISSVNGSCSNMMYIIGEGPSALEIHMPRYTMSEIFNPYISRRGDLHGAWKGALDSCHPIQQVYVGLIWRGEFLPELLMPIVTIDEVQNDSRITRSDSQRLPTKQNNVILQSDIYNTKENKLESPTVKLEDTSDGMRPSLLVPKTEQDVSQEDQKQSTLPTVNMEIKEEKKDSEELLNDNENKVDEILLQTVSRVIQLATKHERHSGISVEGKFADQCIEHKEESTPNVEPVKRKRGRPRKNPEEKVTMKKGKKGRCKKAKSFISRQKTEKRGMRKMKIDESELPKYPCPICKGAEMRTEKQLRLHYKNDHGGRRLRTAMLSTEMVPCDVCGKEFRSSYHLKEHMETHSNYYCCEVCNSSHRKVLDYVIHLRIHSEKGFFKCVYCPFITEEIVEITEHLNGSHETTPQYTCQICKKSFNIESWYEEHNNYHTGLKPYPCDLCGKHFMYSRYLSAHRNFMHKDELGGLNIHECVICHKQYQHRNSLKLHMNSHTGNFAICDVCGKILSSREKLKFHMRTHTGYKPFDCSYCGKCFTKKPILVEHIRIHTGERPYVCEYCTKAFSQRSSLVIHIRSHTGERPFVCHLCQKGFVAKAMLNIHLKACRGAMSFE